MKEENRQEKSDQAAFPVVGIGSSAGGVEALQALFSTLPSNLKATFILIQHLQPDRPSMLVEILSRITKMPVVEAKEGTKIRPGQAYMIPPNKFLSLKDDVLTLTAPVVDGIRMPVNFLFRSLAKEKGEASIGIVLSGTGSDGTLGLREIHGVGGITIVQDPSSAQYGQMPQSAISTGIVDHIVPPEKIGELLGRYVQRVPLLQPEAPASTIEPVVQPVLASLKQATGNDFSLYKTNTLYRRIGRRMNVLNIQQPQQYQRYLKEHREEAGLLFRELLIRVTSFFRDPGAFKELKEEILPRLFAKRPDEHTVRVWVAGCSTGEEAYSIAMVLDEFSRTHGRDFSFQMFATDLDEPSVEQARAGFYPLDIAADVSEERLHRFFVSENRGYRIRKELREKIIFAVQDVLRDPPFTKLDLLSCRNLMIYLTLDAQKRLLDTFHYSLAPGGILFLGSSETIGIRKDLFETAGRKWKFYEARPTQGYPVFQTDAHMLIYRLRPPGPVVGQPKELAAREAARREILDYFSPPFVVVDEVGGVVYIHGQTGRFLEPAPGGPRFNIYDMARKGLRGGLHAVIHKAISQKTETISEMTIRAESGRVGVRVRAKPLSGAEGLYIVVFEEVIPPEERAGDGREAAGGDDQRVTELEGELRRTREDLQTMTEEFQTAMEEQKSTSEELQSSNEELQSTNEELETSKEELQSINEELVTVNSELEEKVRQLGRAESDMKNLLDSVSVGAIFVDTELRIKSFTADIKAIANLLPSDTDRPLGDLATNLRDADLSEDARKVLETLQVREKEVEIRNGEWYLMRVRPYRTTENIIGGVVLTFNNVTLLKKAAEEAASVERIKAAGDFARASIDTMKEPLLTLSEDLRIVSANRSFYRLFDIEKGSAEGRLIYEIADRQLDNPELRHLLEQVLPKDSFVEDYRMTSTLREGQQKKLLLNARTVVTSDMVRLPFILIGIQEENGPAIKSSS
ncbi:MAG: Chemotaxis protein methyltransferase Cher2 [Syntrophorhabdaceae bacterium PtaU1.Bin034]|nr:MAG: Chemotaxis protein methyltransferase Cher2 [Syntrophorhabdaceae bacterium PtaU1.Bin034]